MALEELLGQLPLSLLASSLYAMAAVGLTLNYSVTKIADFAYAEYITLGSYAAAWLTLAGLDAVLALAAAASFSGLVALIVDEGTYKPLERRGSTPLQLLIATLAVGLAIRYAFSIYADQQDLLFLRSGYRLDAIFYLGNRPFTNLHVLALSTLVGSVVILTLVSLRSRVGKAMRAVASNRELALVSGLPVWRVRRLARFFTGGLAGAAGSLWAFYTVITPESGWRLLLWIFSASIIGGLTSYPLTLVGGFLIGFAENLGMWSLNSSLGLDTAYKPLIPYFTIAAALLYRSRIYLKELLVR